MFQMGVMTDVFSLVAANVKPLMVAMTWALLCAESRVKDLLSSVSLHPHHVCWESFKLTFQIRKLRFRSWLQTTHLENWRGFHISLPGTHKVHLTLAGVHLFTPLCPTGWRGHGTGVSKVSAPHPTKAELGWMAATVWDLDLQAPFWEETRSQLIVTEDMGAVFKFSS